MAEAIYMESEQALEGGEVRRRLPLFLLLTALIGILPLFQRQASQLRNSFQIHRPRPPQEVILWGLHQQDPELLQAAFRALARLPPGRFSRALSSSHLSLNKAARAQLHRLLRRRGDREALGLLSTLGGP